MRTRPPSTRILRSCPTSRDIPTSGAPPIASALTCLGWPSHRIATSWTSKLTTSSFARNAQPMCENGSPKSATTARQCQNAGVAGVDNSLGPAILPELHESVTTASLGSPSFNLYARSDPSEAILVPPIVAPGQRPQLARATLLSAIVTIPGSTSMGTYSPVMVDCLEAVFPLVYLSPGGPPPCGVGRAGPHP